MNKTQVTLKREATTGPAVLYTAFELSNAKWKLAFSNGDKVRHVTVAFISTPLFAMQGVDNIAIVNMCRVISDRASPFDN